MNHRSLQGRLQAQICKELPGHLATWTGNQGGHLPEYLQNPTQLTPELLQQELSELAVLMQKSRALLKILGHQSALQQNIALEVFLCLMAKQPELTEEATQLIIDGLKSLYGFLLQASLGQFSKVSFSRSKQNKLLALVEQLDTEAKYGKMWQTFSVRHLGRDRAKLHLSGVDILSLDSDKLQLYIVEVVWVQLVERATGLIGFLKYLNRNGRVYDVRLSKQFINAQQTQPGQQGQQKQQKAAGDRSGFVVRILYASKLDSDFVEAFINLPTYQIHAVRQKHLRRHLPAWGSPKLAPVENICLNTPATKSLEELIAEYNLAFVELIAESQEEHRKVMLDSFKA